MIVERTFLRIEGGDQVTNAQREAAEPASEEAAHGAADGETFAGRGHYLHTQDHLARRGPLLTDEVHLVGKLQGEAEEPDQPDISEKHSHLGGIEFPIGSKRRARAYQQGKDHVHWKKELEHEHENLRAALEFATIEGSPALAQLGLRLASTLSYFWFLRGYHEESHDWLEKLRQLPQLPRSTAEYTYLLCVRAHWMSNVEEAHHLFEEGISLSYALNDARVIAETHQSRATFGWLEADPSTALGHFQQIV